MIKGSLVSDPGALSINQPTPAVFSLKVYGDENLRDVPASITLEQVNADGSQIIKELGKLKDDGTEVDDLAGDWVCQGQVVIEGNAEGKIYFRASYDAG